MSNSQSQPTDGEGDREKHIIDRIVFDWIDPSIDSSVEYINNRIYRRTQAYLHTSLPFEHIAFLLYIELIRMYSGFFKPNPYRFGRAPIPWGLLLLLGITGIALLAYRGYTTHFYGEFSYECPTSVRDLFKKFLIGITLVITACGGVALFQFYGEISSYQLAPVTDTILIFLNDVATISAGIIHYLSPLLILPWVLVVYIQFKVFDPSNCNSYNEW